MIMKDPVLLVK